MTHEIQRDVTIRSVALHTRCVYQLHNGP